MICKNENHLSFSVLKKIGFHQSLKYSLCQGHFKKKGVRNKRGYRGKCVSPNIYLKNEKRKTNIN